MHPCEARPGLPWAEVAASSCRAYAASTGGKNVRGEPMPEWVALSQAIRTAWEAAVRQAGDLLAESPHGLGVEQRWAGWTPPGHHHP